MLHTTRLAPSVLAVLAAAAAGAICFDHQHNEVVVFSSTARTVSRFDPRTLALRASRQIPASVVVGPEPRIAVCPVGGYVWLTSGLMTGYGLVNETAGTMRVAGTIWDAQPLRGVDTDDRGHFFTAAGGQTIEFRSHGVSVLAWARVDGVSRFAGLADGPIFRIAKSNTNYQRDIHDRPEKTLAVLPGIVAPGQIDCPADYNLSGNLSMQDVFDFLAAYFAGDFAADFNGSGSVTVQDVFDFLAAYFRGCS